MSDLLSELSGEARPQAVAKLRYTHADMIDYILANPAISQGDLAARYGYTQAWICQVMQSDAWQVAFAARRDAMVDPELVATINERFRAVTNRSLQRLMERLDAPAVSDSTILKAAELGAKALGVGGNAPPAAPAADHLAQLANRLISLQANIRTQGATYENEIPAAG